MPFYIGKPKQYIHIRFAAIAHPHPFGANPVFLFMRSVPLGPLFLRVLLRLVLARGRPKLL